MLTKDILDMKLVDDGNNESGGISFLGETVRDFIESIDATPKTIQELNELLYACGIKIIDPKLMNN